MFSDQTAEISLDAPSRCLDAVRADTTTSRFFAATCSLLDTKLHLLRHHSELGELGVDGVFEVSVESMCTSSHDTGLIVTTHSKEATVYRIADEIMSRSDELEYKSPEDEGDVSTSTAQLEEELELEQLLTLDSSTRLAQVLWRDSTEVLALERNGHVTRWNTDTDAATAFQMVPQQKSITLPRMACDAHNIHCLAVTAGSRVNILDFRQDSSLVTETVSSLGTCRSSDFTDVHYNPNKPHVLATGGQDGLVKFWDLRQHKKPLLSVGRGGHLHWVSRVEYNPFHDQLVLSSGTDAVVNLWHMATISSAPPLQSQQSDAMVYSHEHMDSVYDVAWGAADAWIYASVGYDGKVLLNHVPSNEKYKILL